MGEYGTIHCYGNNIEMRIPWSETVNEADNTSTITIGRVEFKTAIAVGDYNFSGSVTVNGITIAKFNRLHWYVPDADAATWYSANVLDGPSFPWKATVPHNGDGTAKATFASRMNVNVSGGYGREINGDSSANLTTIPRKSSFSISSGDIGSPLTVSINKASPSFTHTITYSFGSTSGTIKNKTSDTYFSWTPPLDLCRQLPNSTSGTCKATCTTYSGGTAIGTASTTFTLTVPANVKPSVSSGFLTAEADNAGTPVSSLRDFVQGYSRAQFTFHDSLIDLSGAYGATIEERKVSMDGVDIPSPYKTGILQDKGTKTITAVLTDSRGRTVSGTITITVVEYGKPGLTGIEVFRCDKDGKPSSKGTYISVKASVGNLSNGATANLYCSFKPTGGSYGQEIPLQDGVAKIIGGNRIDTQHSWVVKIIIRDSLGNTSQFEQTVATEQTFFHGLPGGKGAAFGKFAEEEGVLDIAWDLKIKGKSLLDIIFPDGTIYESTNSTDPSVLFGGSWETIPPSATGRFAWKKSPSAINLNEKGET